MEAERMNRLRPVASAVTGGDKIGELIDMPDTSTDTLNQRVELLESTVAELKSQLKTLITIQSTAATQSVSATQPTVNAHTGKAVSTGTAAKLLQISTNSLYSYVEKGLIPCYRLPGSNHRRFKLCDIETFSKQYHLSIDYTVLDKLFGKQ